MEEPTCEKRNKTVELPSFRVQKKKEALVGLFSVEGLQGELLVCKVP